MFSFIQHDFTTYNKKLLVDVVITDPPYGNNYGSQRKKIKDAVVNGDTMNWLPSFSSKIFDVCPVGPVVMFCDRHHRSSIELEMKKHANFLNDAIWFKRPWGIGYNFRPAHEHILLFSRSKSVKAQHFSLSSVLQANKTSKKHHPTEKPVDLMRQLVLGLSKEGDIVLDPFMGSGSTGVACKETGRSFVGFDIIDEYVQTAKRRVTETKRGHNV